MTEGSIARHDRWSLGCDVHTGAKLPDQDPPLWESQGALMDMSCVNTIDSGRGREIPEGKN